LKRSSTSAQCISAAQQPCIIAPKLIREIDSGGISGIKAADYESRQKQDRTSIVMIREKAVAELSVRLELDSRGMCFPTYKQRRKGLA
jgi:hypothetical protein